MWKDPEPDPGGTTQKGAPSGQELSDLKDQNEQQQLLIAQLKEMLRKEQSNVTQEKVEEYVNTLNKAKAKKTRVKRDESGTERSASSSSIDVNKKEKLNLLRQQMEENKARLAERGKNQKGIEDMVTQLKAQLNDSQQLINLAPHTSPEPKTLDYSRNSTPEELYNILLTKEKRITELVNRTQNQEATILDLQENVKEKDSVIDARTKAITLMTESLSKKGKNTLDELDDTKEQMRKMQESFVTLEAEMKARQVKLLNDLKAKNLEIAELQESLQEVNKLKKEGTSVDSNEEIAALKKQLEEGNKNMIKVKAQSKSKIKELTKKIDAFRKISDANALVVQLQTENTKLSEKIAELEEEKGNMQLKMVESTESVKDSTLLEEHKELEDKLARKVEELDEKDKIISLLESDIISLKEEVKSLNEKISGLSHWENMEVTSEMKSIQIEEQMEKVEGENAALKKEIEEMLREKEELSEKIEELKKEKQELSSKLDNYIQENMELIDKLEKLSAEKVSSAESIEIVEGLTQQEKLELAAYQKNLDVHFEGEPIKCGGDDDVMDPPVELNESVMQLSEDSTELLQKIDMFTMERKEVMDKLETLKEENARLSMKIKEIENNRDILAETYEQLQNEKEEMQHENDELARKLRSFEEEGGQNAKISGRGGTDLTVKLEELQDEYEQLLTENDELKRTLKEYDSKIHEKHNLETELSLARNKIETLETNIKTNLEELTFYQSLVEENKTELINSANLINELQTKLDDRENDVKDLNLIINDLNGVVNNLQEDNAQFCDFESVIQQLKTDLNDRIQQVQDYEEDIARNNDIIENLQGKLTEMNRKIIEAEHDMEMKEIEAKKLAQELANKEETIKNLQDQNEQKDKKINVVVEDMKRKYLSLQKQLDGNSDSLEIKVQELTTKNKEQMEKMKKIAANLKKKAQAYQELEAKYSGEKEKWESEMNEKVAIIEDSKDKMEKILQRSKEMEEEIADKTRKLAETEDKIRELTEIVWNLEQNNAELQNSLTELRHREEKLNDVNLKQELSTSLHEEFDAAPGNQESASEEKIKELELIIETNNNALAHYTERVHKLEEDVARLVEEKEIAERKAMELSEQLNITSKNAEEKALAEEELGHRLAQVAANDEALVRKLDETVAENKELADKNKELEELTYKLKVKVKKAHERVTQLKALQASVEELEATNGELRKQLAALEASQRHAQDENEELQKRSRNDYERIEADYQTQMEQLVGGRNELQIECEKLREALKEMQAREEELLAEVGEYKGKMERKEGESQERIQELADELRVANLNWKDALEEIASLNDIIAKLRTELVTKVATETVESVITEARDKVIDSTTVACQAVVEIKDVDCQRDRDETSVACQAVVELKHVDCQKDRDDNSVGSQAVLATKDTDTPIEPQQDQIGTEAIPTFQWPTSQQPSQMQDWFAAAPAQEDPFSVIIAQEQSSSNVPRTGSDPSHVATPVDNTKEELLNKIRALEVLLYNVDKEKEEALRDCVGMINELTRLLYEKVNAPRVESTAPISDMDSQITQERDALDAASKKKELHDIEFEKADVSLGEQSHPVVEEVVQPKRAYLTYQPEDKASSSVKPEAFGENDDGWGWGPEEAKLEEEHMSKAENDPRMQNLRSEIDQLKEKLRVLQVERENHLEEIKQLQIKSGKLIKKCKELKLKNDQMAAAQQRKKSDGAEFFNLDETIQEELKTQIAQLEKKIKELTGELEKEKLEKTNTLKRVDVLTAANERMVDMKEIQDAEVLRWKRKHEEAEEKLQHYEWGSDGFNEGAKPTKGIPEQAASTSGDANKIEELQQTIRELSADNDELQALLDEQRQLRVNAEKAKATRTEEEYELLNGKILLLEQELSGKVEEMKAVLEEKEAITRSKTHLEEALNAEQKLVEELRTELGAVMEKNTELERFLADKDKSVKELLENEKGQSVQEELTRKIAELEDTVMQLRSTIARQEKLLEEKSAAFGELQASFDEVDRLKEHLSKQVAQLTTDLDYQRENYAQLQSDASETNSNLQRELKDQQQRCEQLEMASLDKVNELSAELERVKRAYDQLQADGALKVAQLSEELQQQIMKYDQLQAENSEKVSELEALARGLRDEKNATVGGGEFEAAQQQHQLEGLMTEKDLALAELTENKAQLQREVEELTRRLEEKEKELERAVAETDEKISRAAADLEESWIAQVDQRGADIAESWKLHLDAVEAEFATTREKFKYEIDELEGKCNALVNENNELRKNVDAEIRNEVDRISALQQQINDRQQYITELNNKLIEKQNENEILLAKLKQLEHEKEQLKNDLVDKETKLSSMNVIFDTTQKQFDEKREVVEEIVRILEKNTSWPLSFEKQELLTEFQRQLSLVSEKEQEIMRLTRSVSEIQGQLNAIREKDEEIARFKRLTDDLQSQLSTLHEKDDEIFRLTKLAEESQQQLTVVHEKEGEILTLNKLVEDLQKELVSLRDKDAEIARLNRVIEELQRQIGSLQGYEGEILRLNQVIENYKAQHDFNQQEMARLAEMQSNADQAIEDYKQKLDEFTTTHVVLQNSLDEKNQLIATLNQQLQFAENLKNDNNKNVEYLREEISQSKKDCATLQESLSECQQQLFAVTSDLANRTQEIEKLNQQLAYSQRNFEIQEAELNKLRELMQAKEQEYAVLVEGVRQGQLRDLENHYEEVLAAKDLDIESARSQLQESIENYEKLSENVEADANLRRQLEENSKQLEAKVAEQSALLDEDNKQLIELRDIIEDQVMRIEALKKEVFEKSGDYDSLVAEIDIGRKAITQQPTSSANVAETQRERPQQEEEDLSEPVSRAELDLALYMLHQRDVRCEELTVELTQLLEERDTLQLRLSNAIREKEEIRRKLTGSEEVPTSSTSTSSPATPLSKSSAIFLAASGTELATEPSESSTSGMQELENKLSELKSVGYKKDKTFVDEQQLRRMQQISIMQQHMNEASRLPAEAAAKLVDASYTLSRDVQSPSKVLLNWLWGRSTPKVNDT